MIRATAAWIFVPIVAACSSSPPDRSASVLERNEAWSFSVAPSAWLANVDGRVRAGLVRATIDTDFVDGLDEMDLVGQARLEAWRGDWGVTLDPAFGTLSNEAQFPPGPNTSRVETDFELVGFGVTRRVWEGVLGRSGEVDARLEGSLGATFTSASTDVRPGGSPQLNSGFKERWFDPYVASRGTIRFGDRWRARLAASVGGFDIGDAAKLTWGGEAFVGYALGEDSTLWVGYRYLSIERRRGVGTRVADIDFEVFGPTIGVEFRF